MKLYNKNANDQWDCEDVCMTITARFGTGGGNVPIVTYQKVTGPLMANSHPGSYCGQDAYSDMLIAGGTNDRTDLHGNRTSQCGNHEGGGVQH